MGREIGRLVYSGDSSTAEGQLRTGQEFCLHETVGLGLHTCNSEAQMNCDMCSSCLVRKLFVMMSRHVSCMRDSV